MKLFIVYDNNQGIDRFVSARSITNTNILIFLSGINVAEDNRKNELETSIDIKKFHTERKV